MRWRSLIIPTLLGIVFGLALAWSVGAFASSPSLLPRPELLSVRRVR